MRPTIVLGALAAVLLSACGAGDTPAVSTTVQPTWISTSGSTTGSPSSTSSATSSSGSSSSGSAGGSTSGAAPTTDTSIPTEKATWPGGDGNQQPDPVDPEQANLSDIKTELKAYHDSGQYLADLTAMDARAQECMLTAAAGLGASAKPALVLDIDETALSNYDWMVSVDFLRDSPMLGTLFAQHAATESIPAIEPTLELYRKAVDAGITVFFITGRSQALQAVTEANLRNAGYTEFGPSAFTAVGSSYTSAADFKAPARAAIEAQGYTIVANIGDQNSDLEGGHGTCQHKLPDPYYFIL